MIHIVDFYNNFFKSQMDKWLVYRYIFLHSVKVRNRFNMGLQKQNQIW